MLKALVVDDEPLVRMLILKMIKWEDFGLTFVGQACSAEEGLEMIEALKPDVVFTDIMMPTMNGLEFTRRIKEINESIRVILVSGHSEFSYANEGIKLGVFDYILKPLDMEELKDVAVRVRDDILAERKHEEDYARLKEELDTHAQYICEKALYSLILNENDTDSLECLRYFSIELSPGFYQVAIIGNLSAAQVPGNDEKIQHMVQTLRCKKAIHEYLKGYKGIYVFSADTGMIILLNNNPEINLDTFGTHMRHIIEKSLNLQLTLGIGRACKELSQLKTSFREANETLKYRYAFGSGRTFCYEDVCLNNGGTEEILTEDMLHKFAFYVKSGMVSDAEKFLDELFEKMKHTGLSRDYTMGITLKLLMEVLPVLTELRGDESDAHREISDTVTLIMNENNMSLLQHLFMRKIMDLASQVNEKVSSKEKDIASKVQQYLNDHYNDEELTLAGVAGKYYVNSSYLSRIFKEKTGKSFRTTLFEIRMENAKRLFCQTDLKAYEVAECVGIKDPHYFSVCFKKFTGESINEYRAKYSKTE